MDLIQYTKFYSIFNKPKTFKVIEVKSGSDLKNLANDDLFTFEGMTPPNNYSELVNHKSFKEYLGKFVTIYHWSGDLMNKTYHLTGDNQYRPDFNFIGISRDSFKNSRMETKAKVLFGARWLGDIVKNNEQREHSKNK